MNYTPDNTREERSEIIWIAGVKYLYDGRMVHTMQPIIKSTRRVTVQFSYIIKPSTNEKKDWKHEGF